MLSSKLSSRSRTTRARVTCWAPLGVLACLLLLAACGGSSSTASTSPTATSGSSAPTSTVQPTASATTPTSSGAATITMSAFSFSGNTSVTIKAGQGITFTSAGTHDLVIGMRGQFSAQNGAPSELNSNQGVMFSPGDSKTIVFPHAGTFAITCTFHPSMQVTITVTP